MASAPEGAAAAEFRAARISAAKSGTGHAAEKATPDVASLIRATNWAMNGWQQIFFYDPDGSVIEVHQAPQ